MASITKQKILIVEDEPDTRLFISNLLSTHGYNIVLAETGTEGLRRALAEEPTVVIIDMMMPNDGGIRLYRDLKRNPKLDRIPVIMLSTIARKTFFKWQKARSSGAGGPPSGADIYLGLPPEADELLLVVDKLSKSESRDRSPALT